MTEWPQSLVLAGAGKMGGAMLRGWLAGGLPKAGVTLIEPHPSPDLLALVAEHGLKLNPETIAAPEALILAVKPQMGRGAAAGAASSAVSAIQRAWTERLMRTVGIFEWLADETLIDAVTALSGSGPAYAFALVEAMAKAGEALGLPYDLAMRLARATVEGAGELMHQEPGTTAAQLRVNVTSPHGTTAAALAVLQAPDGLDPLMGRAIAAAHRRAGELAG